MNWAILPYYEQIAVVHGATGLVAKLGLLSVFGAALLGNVRPSHLLIGVITGLQFFLAGWMGFSFALSSDCPPGIRTPLIIVSLVSLACIVGSVLPLILKANDWELSKVVPWKLALGGAFILWGIWLPSYSNSWLKAVFFSPVGVLPHSALFALIGAAIISYPTLPRYTFPFLVMAALLVGTVDLFVGVKSSWLLVLAAGVLVFEKIRVQVAGDLQERRSAKQSRVKEEEPDKGSARPKRGKDKKKEWKLK